MVLFEVFITSTLDHTTLLSAEVQSETGATIFTPEEAKQVGLQGIPAGRGKRRALIACAPRDQRFIASRLEGHGGVVGYDVHQVG